MTSPGYLTDREGKAHRVALPAQARGLTSLSRVDYTDAFLLPTDRAQDRTAERWARAMLEDTSASTRRALRRAWFALGVRLGPADDPERVLGWSVRRSSPDVAVLGVDSRFGLEAEVLVSREPGALLVATIMKLDNPLVRAFWARFSPRHRHTLRRLLEQASAR